MGRRIKVFKNKDLEQAMKKNMVLTSGIPLVLAALFIFLFVSYNTLYEFKRSLSDSAEKCAQLINSEMDMFLTKSNILQQNRYLVRGLQNDYAGDIEKMMALYENLEILIAEPFGDKYRGFFTIYPFNESIYESNYIERYERIQELSIEEKITSLGDVGILWWDELSIRKYRDNAAYIRFYRNIKDFDKTIGILEANIPFESIKRIMNNTVIPQGAILVIKDAQGKIQYLRNDKGNTEEAAMTFSKDKYMDITVKLLNSQTITAAMPYSIIIGSLTRLFLVVIGVLLLAFFVMYYISKYSARNALYRLKRFIEVMRQDESLLLDQDRIPESEDGEVAVIERKFKDLLSRMNELHQETAQVKLERSRFELELLQARINPHLLYNSLSVIKWNAQWNKDAKTAELIDNMTRYYRAALNKGNSIIKISEELNMIRDYVRINEFSYCCNYTLDIQMEEAVLNCYTFKHLLQPIVENAILHGLNGREQGGSITITGKRVEDRILITVSDNGVGMNEEKVKQLLHLDSSGTYNGYGMKNLVKRIHMYFGEDCGINIFSIPSKGTQIDLRIGAVDQKELLEKNIHN